MRDSRVSIQNKLPSKQNNCPPKSNISSLKAIINQGRVPLSQYINHRPQKPAPLHQHLSYFDKLKAMFNREGDQPVPFQNNCNQIEQPGEGMDIELPNNKFMNYPNNYQENVLAAEYKNSLQCKTKNKTRSISVNAKTKYVATTANPLPRPSHSKTPTFTQDNYVQSNSTQVQQSNKIPQNVHNMIRSTKSYKKQTINYKKYNVMFQNQEWMGGLVDLQEVLGSGATATVRIGRDKKTSRQFAVKIYEKYKLVDSCKKKRVLQQIQLLGKLKHPNIVAMTHCFQDKRQIHLILELVPEAETLHDFIRRHSYEVPSSVKKEIGVKIIQAVKYMHSLGVSHRDIKTQNVILGAHGIVKLIDFGFATKAARTQTHCGTPNYMAPELFEKKTVYSPMRVDVWALGVLLYYLHEGCYPFRGYNEKDLIRSIFNGNVSFKKCDQKVRKVIEIALVAQQKERATVQDLLQILKS